MTLQLPVSPDAYAQQIAAALESQVSEVQKIDTFQTDRGSPCFVLVNGAVKAEAWPCKSAEGDWPSVIAETIAVANNLRRASDTRLSWRARPRFETGEDGVRLRLRMAWD